MKHIFQKGSDATKPTLLLLHGTGGDEYDLLPLARMVDEGASVLSVRGEVLENGMPRFFRRLAEGVFDEQDLIARTAQLNDFLNEASEKYEFDRDNVVALGYSNGANIAANLLFQYAGALKGAILHHPMVPRRGIELPNLNGIAIFIAAGQNDPICPATESKELEKTVADAGASVSIHWENNGHSLSRTEVEAAREWYQHRFL